MHVGKWVVGIAASFVVAGAALAAPGSTPEQIAAAGLTDEEMALFDHVKNEISVESFVAVPWHLKKMLAIVAQKAETGALDGKRVPAYCFEGNVPSDVVEYLNRAYYQSGGEKFNEISSRWTSTASAGTGATQGEPAVLTYSFVPDGTLIPGDSTIIDTETSTPMADANSDLQAFLTGIYGSEAAWQALFAQVFDDWSSQTGITYVFEPNDDGASFPDSGVSNGSPGQLGVRGDIRIAGIRIDGATGGNILAFNFFPNAGDMVIDTSNGSTLSNSLRFRNVVAHEHGHGLGMPHTCPINSTKLMEPFVSLAFDGVQQDDRLSGQRTYGDPNEKSGGNDTSVSATDLGVVDDSIATESTVSLDDNSDVDFFAFTTAQGSDVTITVTPIGTTYLSDTQQMNGDCNAGTNFNALTVANLDIELIDTNGTTVLSTGAAGAAGVAETIVTNLDTPGTYFVRVFQNATVNNVQGYDLSVQAEAAGPAVQPVANFNADVTSGPATLTVQFTDTSTNTPTSWAWDFENNGSTDSTAQNPSHDYTAPGTYTVKLTATNTAGSDDEIKIDFITVQVPEPVAGFNADITSGTAPLTVQFTDTSTNTPTSWAWDFDNNGSTDSTQQNPSHQYAAPGVYSVKLTATNGTGFDEDLKTNFITVTTLETTIDVTNGGWVEVGDEVVFTAGPGGAIGYQWFKDNAPLGGETNQMLIIDSAAPGDAGFYYCEVTTASKGIANTPTVELIVFAVGTLPLGGAFALGLLAGALVIASMILIRRRRHNA